MFANNLLELRVKAEEKMTGDPNPHVVFEQLKCMSKKSSDVFRNTKYILEEEIQVFFSLCSHVLCEESGKQILFFLLFFFSCMCRLGNTD